MVTFLWLIKRVHFFDSLGSSTSLNLYPQNLPPPPQKCSNSNDLCQFLVFGKFQLFRFELFNFPPRGGGLSEFDHKCINY